MIKAVKIKNYRAFEDFSLDFIPGANIIVGDNDSGKSTILEAIHLAFTNRVRGRLLSSELSPYLFNLEATRKYIERLAEGGSVEPPEMIVEVYLEPDDQNGHLRGMHNMASEDAVGLRVRAAFNPEFSEEFESYVEDVENVKLVPTEYYHTEWLSFSGNPVSPRSAPSATSLIDASTIRLASGADYYLQEVIKSHLADSERVELARAYRSLREAFAENEPVKVVNEKLSATQGEITDKSLALAIDISQKFTWESSLTPHLDDVPLTFVGSGEQSILKILLAVNRRLEKFPTILIEEPENHLAFPALNVLIRKIEERCEGRQVVGTTHSSFVLNKLGLDKLVLTNRTGGTRLGDLPADTQDYFKKLSGYDTLRVVLARKTVLVEGPSDELVVQRAYLDLHGRLPIQDGIDVLNVRGLSFHRFLDIASPLQRRAVVITDNDGDPARKQRIYERWMGDPSVSIHYSPDASLKTLEPQIVAANSLEALNAVLGTHAETKAEVQEKMTNDKTWAALRVFESERSLTMPDYITGGLRGLE